MRVTHRLGRSAGALRDRISLMARSTSRLIDGVYGSVFPNSRSHSMLSSLRVRLMAVLDTLGRCSLGMTPESIVANIIFQHPIYNSLDGTVSYSILDLSRLIPRRQCRVVRAGLFKQ